MEHKTLLNVDHRRDKIREQAVSTLKKVFPFVGKRYTIDVDDVKVHEAKYTPEDHKRAILQARSMAEPIRGTLLLKDNKTGKVIDKIPKFNLLQLPYFTPHGTFVLGGSSYSVSNQLRMKPGVYTRKRKNEELEAGFNLSKGDNFRLSMDPEKGHFKMEYQTTKIPLYPVLRRMGVSDSEIAKHWNPEVVKINKKAFESKADDYVGKLYKRIVPRYSQKPEDDQIQRIKQTYDDTSMDPEINKRTLGKPYDKVSNASLLAASGKLLKAYSQEADFDERDSLAFKQLLSVDDFIRERIELESRDLRRKTLFRADSTSKPELKKIVSSSPFTRSVQRFLATSQLSNNPDQINPIEMIDAAVRVTSLGEGGIGSTRAIPDEARRVHTSQMGILDPVRTPENERIGIDLRTTLFASKDDRGDMYLPVKDAKTKRVVYRPVAEIVDKTVAFPGQEIKGQVDVVKDNQVQAVPASQVDYTIPAHQGLYSPAASLIPFINSMDGNRATMASKMQTQALPLIDSEAPLIQVKSHVAGRSMEEVLGDLISPRAPVSGVIEKIKEGFIYIRPKGKKTAAADDDDGLVVRDYHHNFPLASKTYINHQLKVKKGDEVKKGQPLAQGAFVRDGQLALGKNLLTAYMPWRGLNSNDAVVISESAAKKLTSTHMYKEGLDVERDMKADRESHRSYYGNAYTASMYDKLDDGGVVKPGQKVEKGDLLITALRKSTLTPESAMLGKLHKSLVKPYRDAAVIWHHDTPGEVTDVVRAGNKIRMTIKTQEPTRIGDKISGRFGNKGVVSTIVPDEQMVQNEGGETVDVVVTPAGVVSRINPAQILETALAKVAKKTGKRILVDNAADHNNVDFVKAQLKEHGIKDKETVLDPITGKKIPNVFVGPQYTMKLFKSTETNFSARGVEDYDVNQQPSGGGPKGAKGLGAMEVNALLAHGARNILHEATALKSQRNDEYWRAFQLGLPLPSPKTSFSYDKFGAMLAGAGVRVSKKANQLRLTPLTDLEIDKMAPQEITRPLFVRAKDLRPERHGLFDPAATGGTAGTKWSKIKLTEPVVNPIFEKPVQTLLGVTKSELNQMLRDEGGKGIRKRLDKVDVAKRARELLKKVKTLRGAERDKAVKELKYLGGLKKADMKPSEAYVLSRIPVVPPVFRPILPGKGGDLQVSDSNYLYRDLMLADDLLRKSKDLPDDVQQDARRHVYDATKALFGLGDPVSPQAKGRNVRGFISNIAGVGSPKPAFFQSKMIKRRMDVSGRGTIVPDSTLHMDEVGIPEEMGWEMYKPFVIRRMVQRGFPAVEARSKVEEKSPVAKEFLQQEIQDRPLLLNRAPSLRRYNVLAAYPKLVPGKSIRIHELQAPIMAGDFDGDTVQVHVPVQQKAIEEAKGLTLSKMLLGDQYKQQTIVVPQHESVSGIYDATVAEPKGKTRKFKTKAEAMAAYHRGDIELGTPVEVGK